MNIDNEKILDAYIKTKNDINSIKNKSSLTISNIMSNFVLNAEFIEIKKTDVSVRKAISNTWSYNRSIATISHKFSNFKTNIFLLPPMHYLNQTTDKILLIIQPLIESITKLNHLYKTVSELLDVKPLDLEYCSSVMNNTINNGFVFELGADEVIKMLPTELLPVVPYIKGLYKSDSVLRIDTTYNLYEFVLNEITHFKDGLVEDSNGFYGRVMFRDASKTDEYYSYTKGKQCIEIHPRVAKRTNGRNNFYPTSIFYAPLDWRISPLKEYIKQKILDAFVHDKKQDKGTLICKIHRHLRITLGVQYHVNGIKCTDIALHEINNCLNHGINDESMLTTIAALYQ